MASPLELLITVKAYPNPSSSYGEAACIAGVTRDGAFRRLYPMPFRKLEDDQQFQKYQWIRVSAQQAKSDPRPETLRPVPDSIEGISPVLSRDHAWASRWDIIKQIPTLPMCDIQDAQKQDGTSLGFFRPAEILDVEAEHEESHEWTEAELAKLGQRDLFMTKENTLLEKVPVGFYYRYRCEGCRNVEPHRMKIIDWELAALWRRTRRTYDEATTTSLVRQRFLETMCAPDRDTHFFTGNMALHPGSFLILGVFWPPKTAQMDLL